MESLLMLLELKDPGVTLDDSNYLFFFLYSKDFISMNITPAIPKNIIEVFTAVLFSFKKLGNRLLINIKINTKN
jgi:hypothetical protein